VRDEGATVFGHDLKKLPFTYTLALTGVRSLQSAVVYPAVATVLNNHKLVLDYSSKIDILLITKLRDYFHYPKIVIGFRTKYNPWRSYIIARHITPSR